MRRLNVFSWLLIFCVLASALTALGDEWQLKTAEGTPLQTLFSGLPRHPELVADTFTLGGAKDVARLQRVSCIFQPCSGQFIVITDLSDDRAKSLCIGWETENQCPPAGVTILHDFTGDSSTADVYDGYQGNQICSNCCLDAAHCRNCPSPPPGCVSYDYQRCACTSCPSNSGCSSPYASPDPCKYPGNSNYCPDGLSIKSNGCCRIDSCAVGICAQNGGDPYCPDGDCSNSINDFQSDECEWDNTSVKGCPDGAVLDGRECCYFIGSPIVIDTDGSGFCLTDISHGVLFDFWGTGIPAKMSWTSEGCTNAWLVLDRDGNGQIDSAKEMFGNLTAQPASGNPNGFLALAEYDKPENGGNGDGVIDMRDAIFGRLRLWLDRNHNGHSEPDELYTLPQLNVLSVGIKYQEHKWADAFGNHFTYRAKVDDAAHSSTSRWAYDVFLQFSVVRTPAQSPPAQQAQSSSAFVHRVLERSRRNAGRLRAEQSDTVDNEREPQ